MSASSNNGPATETRAVAVAALGSSIVGTVPYFAIGLYQDGMDVASVLVGRYSIALMVLIPLAYWTSPGLAAEWRAAGRGLFLNGLVLGVAQTYTYFRAVESIPSSVVVTVFFVYPMIMLAIDRFIFSMPVRRSSIAAATLIFAGALLAGWPSLSLGSADTVGIICLVLTPFVYSAYVAIAYRYTRQASPFASASAIYLGIGLGYALVVAVTGMKLPASAEAWRHMLAIALIGGVIPVVSFAYALPRLSGARYSIIVSLELVTVVLIGVMFLREQLTPIQFAGVALVAIGIIADRLVRAKR